jgi:hypothetical protein
MDPDFTRLGSRISDPTAKTEEGEKIGISFLSGHKFHKILDCFIFGQILDTEQI